MADSSVTFLGQVGPVTSGEGDPQPATDNASAVAKKTRTLVSMIEDRSGPPLPRNERVLTVIERRFMAQSLRAGALTGREAPSSAFRVAFVVVR
jgi:hypothetical protein